MVPRFGSRSSKARMAPELVFWTAGQEMLLPDGQIATQDYGRA